MTDGSISKQGDMLVKLDNGTVINLAEVFSDIQTATEQDRVNEHLFNNVMKRLNTDASGRLRVAAESVANITTVTNVSAVGATSIGPMLALPWVRMESGKQFQMGFARNLVRT